MSTKFFVTPVTQQLFSTLGCQTVASGANKPFQVVESSRHSEVCSEWLQKAMYSRSGKQSFRVRWLVISDNGNGRAQMKASSPEG